MEEDPKDPSAQPPQLPQPATFEYLPAVGNGGYATPPTFAGEGGLDWRNILHVLWRGRLWIALATALGIGAGFLLSRRSEPVFQTRGTVWVQGSGGNSQTGPIVGPDILQGQGWADLFTSHAVLAPVVRSLNLDLHPATSDAKLRGLFTSFTTTDSVVPGQYVLTVDSTGRRYTLSRADGAILEEDSIGAPIGRGEGFEWRPDAALLVAGATIPFGISSTANAVEALRGDLMVMFNPRAGNLITTRLDWDDARQAATIHNAILDSFLKVAYEIKTQKLREVVSILKKQSDISAERLKKAELAFENFRVHTITLPTDPQASPIPGGAMATNGQNGVVQDPLFNTYFQKKVQRRDLNGDIARIDTILAAVRSGKGLDPVAVQMIPSVSKSADLQQSLKDLFDKQAERRSLLYTFTERHPEVQRVERQIQMLETQTIPAELGKLATELRSQEVALGQEVEGEASELRQIPTRTIEEGRLQRDMQMAEQLHNNLLVRLKQAELAASTSLPELEIVDRAAPPVAPTRNPGSRYFLMASVAGLGLGIGGVLLLDRLDRRVRGPDEVGASLGLPVVGMIPRIEPRRRLKGPDEAQVVLESFRAVRAQLSRSMGARANSVVFITSPSPKDGKTLVASNLAISCAASTGRAVLLDGDTRRGNAHQLFGVASSPGLTEVLQGRVPLAEALRSTDVPGLWLLPRGSMRDFSADLLEGKEMRAVLGQLRASFRSVVVDGPPLVAGADALVLGELADQVLMILRVGMTDRDLARARLEAIGAFDVPLVGVVLNDVPPTTPYYHDYGKYEYQIADEVAS